MAGLLAAGADPTALDAAGRSPLVCALQHGNYDAAGLLEEAGAEYEDIMSDEESCWSASEEDEEGGGPTD